MKNSLVFLVNPISGRGKGRQLARKINRYFSTKSIDFEIHFTQNQGHATDLAKRIIHQNPKTIIACGGDGTINEVAQTLIGTGIPLGIIPIGSGNGLASHLDIPKNNLQAFEVILQQFTMPIDVGKVNDYYFFSNIGFGIDAAVIQQYSKKTTRNFLGYTLASCKALLKYRAKKFHICIDQQTNKEQDYFFLFCSNSNEAGYGISFTPDAKINDHQLNFLEVKKLNFFEQILFSLHVLTRRLDKMKQVSQQTIQQLEIITDESEILAQIDGEAVIFPTNKISISVAPEALKVILPKKLS
ncbi:diacylglycerol kinase family protein [Weeksella sp. HMSC059D05]|uniref:diacylglycerol/lipid kinase family protein n=1 Tax=Weeksella sp. HMSC059D05 TaxID=1715139 RepID=UPI0008A4BDA2|nr:diacylglycerol kinase family protein [Weeksella sp. HMSC059D05]OFM83099.1 hypothetical protein HMPREF2660_02085 [Weeksella sp. HMSC059D05]